MPPRRFSWVAASLVSVATVLQWQSLTVGRARKAARVPYPQGELWRAEYSRDVWTDRI